MNQPRSRARGQTSDVAIEAKEILNTGRVTNELIAKVCFEKSYIIYKGNLIFYIPMIIIFIIENIYNSFITCYMQMHTIIQLFLFNRALILLINFVCYQ